MINNYDENESYLVVRHEISLQSLLADLLI